MNRPHVPPGSSESPPRVRSTPLELPTSLTFFLTHEQRRRVLARLATLHPDRARALLVALAIEDPGPSSNCPAS